MLRRGVVAASRRGNATAAAMAARRGSVEAQGVQAEPRKAGTSFSPGLVIFDKDGTLIDFKFMWGRWAEDLCARLETRGHLDAAGLGIFADALGYDRAKNTVHNRSPLCCTPMHKIEALCVDVVRAHADEVADEDAAVAAIREVWHMPNPSTDTRALTELGPLFEFLREDRGSKIAVCTTDDRDVTLETLEWLGVDHLVDMLVCGDDAHLPPKPDPEQIFHICDELGVHPSRTVMVGDTITDMSMGAAAGVGLRVGIPNGAGSLEDISEHADFILPSMHNFRRVFEQLTVPSN